MKKNKFEFIIDSEFQSQIPACTQPPGKRAFTFQSEKYPKPWK